MDGSRGCYYVCLYGDGTKSEPQHVYILDKIVMYAIGGTILLIIQASIWNALYAQGVRSEASYAETITYIVLYNTILQIFEIKIGTPLSRSVYDGSIGIDMLRPVNLQIQHIAKQFGGTWFRFLTYSLPLLFIAVILYGVLPPANIAYFLAFLLTGILGCVIASIINCIIGYTAFWLMNNWFMRYFENALMAVFGGTLVPLWFYPNWLYSFSAFMPFRYVNYSALELYLGRTPISDLPQVLAMQIFWILVLFGIERLIWHRARLKIIVQGG